ncbi:uncharacterized protein LOC127289421 [Leptopilina boulardi]|uniref:uncharacterized protein LOC127289421 n=1 Tax=Leptopilina boulardi TaxID=63433 RepID=UPI0021F69019|nr:uncharacterized protein LOC127289421 [Leptopilina boulardi]
MLAPRKQPFQPSPKSHFQQRRNLDERCSLNEPSRLANEQCDQIQEIERDIQIYNCQEPKDSSTISQELKIKEKNLGPMIDLLKNHHETGGINPPYFPQQEDGHPVKSEGPMEPVGPWATGCVSYSPYSGITGVRPVVDRYSITRYSPGEWRAHNQTFFNESTEKIREAQTIRLDARHCKEEIYKETDKTQLENRDRLSSRVGVVHRWKTELERALLDITEEIELQDGERRRVQRSLSVLTIPESIAAEFLELRSTRLEPDLVKDDVETELVKELALCWEVRSFLEKSKEQIEEQLLELRSFKNRMECDWTDKADTYEIDTLCVGLKNSSPLILFKNGVTRVPANQTTPEEYDNFTKENLTAAENSRQRSINLRSTLNVNYSNALKDLRTQSNRVNTALAEKIALTEQVCENLEKELLKCLQELTVTENLIEELRGSTKSLNDALKVAQSRLSNRLQRRNVENCRDIPQYGIIEEVKTLGESISTLMVKLRKVEDAQANLVKSRSNMEKEIMVKQKSLYIDRDRGLVLRSFYPSTTKILGQNEKIMQEATHTQEIKIHHKSEPIFFFKKKISKKENEIKEYFPSSFVSKPQNEITSEKITKENKETKTEVNCPLIPNILSHPQPLGPISKTVPLNYWKSLASISGTRPNVDKCSLARFSPGENELRFENLLKANQENFNNASLLAFTALKAMESAFAKIENDSLHNKIKLCARAKVLFTWKQELEQNILDHNSEIKLINNEKKRLKKSINALEFVKSINNETKLSRCLRIEPELVHDQVDEEIIQEAIIYEEISNIYKRCKNHLNLQLQELKDAKQRLECDWSRKEQTYDIDTNCIGLKYNSSNILLKPGSVKLPQNQSSPTTYKQFCKESIIQSQNSLRNSQILRTNMKNIYKSSVHDLRGQADKIDIALDEKIAETINYCFKIENNLKKCLRSMSETEALIDKINNNLEKLNGAMKCTQTCLNERLQREFTENCRDNPQLGLIDSVKLLTENMSNILGQKRNAEDVLAELIKSRKEIERELMIKQNTLYVDRDRCLSIRSYYPSVQCLGGY